MCTLMLKLKPAVNRVTGKIHNVRDVGSRYVTETDLLGHYDESQGDYCRFFQ